jgi:hypothetical protein
MRPTTPEPSSAAAPAFAPLALLPPVLRGVAAFVLLLLNTVFWCLLLFALALLRLLLPLAGRAAPHRPAAQRRGHALDRRQQRLDAADAAHALGRGRPRPALPYRGWYLVTATTRAGSTSSCCSTCLQPAHPAAQVLPQAAADLRAGDGPGLVGAGLPVHAPAHRAESAPHPEKRQQDLDATRRACAKFASLPTSVMNFVEGTRFTPAKHAGAGSPLAAPAASPRPAAWRWRWRAGRALRLAGRRHHRLSRRGADASGTSCAAACRAWSCACSATTSRRLPAQRRQRRRTLSQARAPLAARGLGRQGCADRGAARALNHAAGSSTQWLSGAIGCGQASMRGACRTCQRARPRPPAISTPRPPSQLATAQGSVSSAMRTRPSSACGYHHRPLAELLRADDEAARPGPPPRHPHSRRPARCAAPRAIAGRPTAPAPAPPGAWRGRRVRPAAPRPASGSPRPQARWRMLSRGSGSVQRPSTRAVAASRCSSDGAMREGSILRRPAGPAGCRRRPPPAGPAAAGSTWCGSMPPLNRMLRHARQGPGIAHADPAAAVGRVGLRGEQPAAGGIGLRHGRSRCAAAASGVDVEPALHAARGVHAQQPAPGRLAATTKPPSGSRCRPCARPGHHGSSAAMRHAPPAQSASTNAATRSAPWLARHAPGGQQAVHGLLAAAGRVRSVSGFCGGGDRGSGRSATGSARQTRRCRWRRSSSGFICEYEVIRIICTYVRRLHAAKVAASAAGGGHRRPQQGDSRRPGGAPIPASATTGAATQVGCAAGTYPVHEVKHGIDGQPAAAGRRDRRGHRDCGRLAGAGGVPRGRSQRRQRDEALAAAAHYTPAARVPPTGRHPTLAPRA